MTNPLRRDQNGVPFHGNDYLIEQKSVTLAGGTANNMGDFDGTGNPYTLFTVTGVVRAKVFAVCGVDVAGAGGTIEVGTASSTAGLIAQTTGTDLDAGEIWLDASPTTKVEPWASAVEQILAANVIQTVGTANLTAGTLTYYCLWQPISADGQVTAA